MARALDLAWRGWGRVQPNPLVGAVVLPHGELVGEGWHAGVRRPPRRGGGAGRCGRHGLEGRPWSSPSSPARIRQAAAVHRGDHPAGVRRVVAAAARSESRRRGGADRLRAAGIEVELGPARRRSCGAERHLPPPSARPSRPYVALKLATTLDGRIADSYGRSRWISGAQARDYVQWLRAGFDAIGVGGAPRGPRSVAHRARAASAPSPPAPGGLRPPAADLRPSARRWCAPRARPDDGGGRRRGRPPRASGGWRLRA